MTDDMSEILSYYPAVHLDATFFLSLQFFGAGIWATRPSDSALNETPPRYFRNTRTMSISLNINSSDALPASGVAVGFSYYEMWTGTSRKLQWWSWQVGNKFPKLSNPKGISTQG